MFDKQRETAGKAMYSALGAPVVARRLAEEFGSKFAKFSDRVIDTAKDRYDESATEGKKVAERFQDGNVVEEIQTRVDIDKVQDRVGKLRDQLDAALESWRENFAPSEGQPTPKKVAVEQTKKATASKATASKAPASKAPASKAPASKAPATKKTATSKKAPAKTTANKSTASKSTAKKTTTAKTTAKKASTASKAPAKTTASKSTAKKTPAKASTTDS